MVNLLWPGDNRAGELFSDGAVLESMLATEAAWSVALVAHGLAEESAAVSVHQLRELVSNTDIEELAVTSEIGGNPVIPLVSLLRKRLGEGPQARWLHRGLTSQDVLDTALIRCANECFMDIGASLRTHIASLVDVVHTYGEVETAAVTLTRFAVPMPLGLRIAHWIDGLIEAHDAVSRLVFPAQFGGAGGTSAAVVELAGGRDDPVDIACEVTADAAAGLGLAAVAPWQTVRAPITALADAATGCHDGWGHISNDVLIMGRSEIGQVSETYGGGSSAMPHKSNPALAVQIRRSARMAPLYAAQLHLAATDSADERSAGPWHTEWDTLRTLLRRTVVSGRQLTDMLAGMTIDASHLQISEETSVQMRSEQRVMARLRGHDGLVARPQAGDYLGAAQSYVAQTLARAQVSLDDYRHQEEVSS